MIGAVETLADRVADLGRRVDEVTIDDHGTPIVHARFARTRSRPGFSRAPARTSTQRRAARWATSSTTTVGSHGCSNLFVVDASVFPEIPAAPTYLPTLMLAERLAARLVAGEW